MKHHSIGNGNETKQRLLSLPNNKKQNQPLQAPVPSENTPLHHASFFNVYKNGNVCMGTVSIDIKNSASVEEFIRAWEHYFFNSYFSHALGEDLTRKNIVIVTFLKRAATV